MSTVHEPTPKTTDPKTTDPKTTESSAERELANEADREASGIVSEFCQFVSESGKWWLIPVLVSLLTVAAFVVRGSSGLSPFLYSLF